jgi:hypothetical protein
MSVARSYLGYAPDRSGNPYAIGGIDGNDQPLSSVERYNSDANSWSTIAPLPTPRYNFPAVFDGTNHIYIFGGRTNTSSGSEIPSVLSYSVSANTWTEMAPMPTATAGSAAALAVDGKIYVVGGVSSEVTLSVVQIYDPAANSWTVSTPLPEGLSAAAMGVDSVGRLILMGGMDASGSDVADVWRSQQLGLPDSAPGFVSYPAVTATYQVPYSSSINATGSPPPTYALLNGPAGMQVDYFSGAITWTPQSDQVGTNAVTIRATNYAGFADWTFAIIVPNPPPSVPTNLTVVSVTDTSAVLSWAPESPVVGPTTYTLSIPHPYHSPRGSGGGVNWQVVMSGITSNTVTLTGLLPLSSTTFAVKATAPGGTSAYSSWVTVSTTGPQGPPDLFVTSLTSTTVGLSWDPAAGPAQNPRFSPIVSYTIMERNMAVYPAVNVPTVTGITGTNGTITGLTPGSSHLWFVSGVDAEGYSSPLGLVYVVVTNPVPVAPVVSGSAILPDGSFQFTVQETGPFVQTVVIQANNTLSDPSGWVQIGSILPSGATFTFTDPSAAQYPTRFYRILAQ